MKQYLHHFKITSRHAATAVAVAASVYFSFSAVRNQKLRQQRDLETSSALLADGLREAVEPLVTGSRAHLQEVADRFGKRGHLTGIAVFDDRGEIVARSKSLSKELIKPPRIALDALKKNHESEGYEVIAGKRLRVNAVPLEVRDKNWGVLAVFHDPAFIEARIERTRYETAERMLIQAGLFLLAVWVFGFFI